MTPPLAAILQRVERLHPHNTQAQRRALYRWAGVLRANDPYLAAALMALRLHGSGNDGRRR